MITTLAPRVRVGALFHGTSPPERLPGFARTVERLGYDELWVVEDCFFTAAIATPRG